MSPQTKTFVVLLLTLYLAMLGFGIIIPVLPFYVRHFEGDAKVLGYLMASYSAVQLFMSPVWGRISDRIGRRPVLLIGLAGFAVTFIAYGLATRLWMLFAARILAGLMSSATLPTAMAYIADITTGENRAKGMGLMGASMGLGIISGPAVGGILAEYGLSVPFFVAGGLAACAWPFAWRFLKESRVHHEHTRRDLGFKFLMTESGRTLVPLFILAFIISFTMALFESTFALFAHDIYSMSSRDIGIMFGVIGIIGVAFQGGLMGRLSRHIGDAGIVMLGVFLASAGLASIVGTVGLGSALFFWLTTSLYAMGHALLRPGVSTLVSRQTTAGQGISIGVMQSFDSLGRIIGPVTGGSLYVIHHKTPYTVGAGILGMTFLALVPLAKRFRSVPDEVEV